MSGFRITPDPAVALPEVDAVVSRRPLEIRGAELVGASGWRFEWVPVPQIGEVMAVDVDDPSAFSDFALLHGPMHLDKAFARETSLVWREVQGKAVGPVTRERVLEHLDDEDMKVAWEARQASGESLADFRQRLWEVQAAVSAVEFLESGKVVDTTRPGHRHTSDRTEAMWSLHFLLREPLEAFAPRIRLSSEEGDLTPPPGVTLYEALMGRIFNHLVQGIPYKVCANETCRLLFDAQEGRARYGQYRTDSIYHSRACANAQNQRNYRRRKLSEKKEH